MKMQAIAVGQVAPKFFWRQNRAFEPDGTVFNLLEDGQPFITVYLKNMTEEEAEHISVRQIASAYWYYGGFWLGVLKIGEMLQELAFNPMIHFLNYHSFTPDLFRQNRIVTFVGIDTADMTVKAMHAATYPWKFLASLNKAFSEFCPKSTYNLAYQRLRHEFDRLPLPVLWRNFSPGGYFGEKRAEALN